VREPTRTRTGLPEYGVSKLANVLHAQELARRLADTGVTTYSLHPGAVASDVWRSIPWPIRPLIKLAMRSPQEGAKTSVYCATSAEVAAQTGLYYQDCREKIPGDDATPELGAELWKRSEGWVATAAA
jgi:retinol dehydrogenase-12